MKEDWKLTAEELQELLLVRKVIISPLIGEKLENEDEAGASAERRSTEITVTDSEVHEIP